MMRSVGIRTLPTAWDLRSTSVVAKRVPLALSNPPHARYARGTKGVLPKKRNAEGVKHTFVLKPSPPLRQTVFYAMIPSLTV